MIAELSWATGMTFRDLALESDEVIATFLELASQEQKKAQEVSRRG